MNKYLVAILLLITNNICYSININEAIKGGVKFIVKANTNSVHYMDALTIEFKNSTSKATTVEIPIGTLFSPEDTNYQDIVVTEQLALAIPANGTLIKDIKGMCTEQGDKAGGGDLKYFLKPNNNLNLIKLCNFIAKNKYQNSEAQNAVWTLVSNEPLEEIWGADTVAAKALINEMARITNKPLPMPKVDYTHNYYYSEPMKVEISGKFEWDISDTKSIVIGMFNTNGTLVREVYKNMNQSPGYNKVSFNFDPTVYNEQYYDFKLILDGVVVTNKRIQLKS
jgi:hypothetical protein